MRSDRTYLLDQIEKLKTKLANTDETIKGVLAGRAKTEAELDCLNEKLEAMPVGERVVHVSDHALIRYLQRAMNIDIDGIRREILSDALVHQIRVLGGGGTYPVGEGRAIVKNYHIVTYIKD